MAGPTLADRALVFVDGYGTIRTPDDVVDLVLAVDGEMLPNSA